jgi:predicted nuclease of predicted toxin-antitoxin system
MVAQFYKHKILLDENFYPRSHLPNLNHNFTVKHIVKDLHHSAWSDLEIFNYARKNEMIVVTFNVDDFQDLVAGINDTGVVGVSTNLTVESIDKKLTALFRRSSQHALFGKVTMITGAK